MTTFIEALKQYKCLYDIHADPKSEENTLCWTKLAKQMHHSVSTCHQKWRRKLEDYVTYLQSKDKVPSSKMAVMEFVHDDVLLLLKRAKQLSSDDTEPPVPATLSPPCVDKNDTPVIVMKQELDNTANTVHSMQERPTPQKRARRNAVDDESLLSDTEQETHQYASTPKRQQTVSSVPPVQHSSTNMTTVANRHTQTSPSVTLPMEESHHEFHFNIPTANNASTPNAHAFGMYVIATLNGFTTKKQMAVRGKIFELLQQAELEK